MSIIIGTISYNIGTHCYYLSNTTKTWNGSRTYCMNYSADLLVVESLAEYNFITSVAQTLMPTTDWVKTNNDHIHICRTVSNCSRIFVTDSSMGRPDYTRTITT